MNVFEVVSAVQLFNSLTAHFQTGFYIDGSGQKHREAFLLKLVESLNTETTHMHV